MLRSFLTSLSIGMILSAMAGGPFSVPAPWPDTIPKVKEDQRAIGAALAVFLGPFGAHRLYLGTDVKVAVIYGVTFGGFGVLPLLDLGHMLFSKDMEPYRNNSRVFMWSERTTPP